MKAAFISALAIAGNVAYCQDDSANSDSVCSPSKGGKVCGVESCNDLVSKITKDPKFQVDPSEDGEAIIIGSDMEYGCEISITLLDETEASEGVELDSQLLIDDVARIVESCSEQGADAEWAGQINSDDDGPTRLVEVNNPAAEGCPASESASPSQDSEGSEDAEDTEETEDTE